MKRIPIGTRSRSTRRASRAKRRTSRIPSPPGARGQADLTGLRHAGATIRALIKAAAASMWKVPIEEIETYKGVASHLASGKTANYGDLVKAARDLPVPSENDVKLKSRSEWQLIGK